MSKFPAATNCPLGEMATEISLFRDSPSLMVRTLEVPSIISQIRAVFSSEPATMSQLSRLKRKDSRVDSCSWRRTRFSSRVVCQNNEVRVKSDE